MSEYTKEQEARAIEMMERHELGEAEHIVLAMAKRTAEAEARLEASRFECDALKARVSELNKRPWIDGTDIVQGEHEADCGLVGYTLTYVEPLQRRVAELETRVVELEAKPAPPPVVVTREMVEALSEFARTWARFGADCEPENAAARLVVALGEALEVKP